MIKIIGISGKARAGKDTIASALFEELDCTMRYGMADPIKDALYGMLQAERIEDKIALMNNKEEPIDWLGHSPRAMLQEIGGSLRENLSEDIWVRFLDKFVNDWKAMEEAFGNYEDHYPVYVIVPDVRYNNEAEYIKDNAGYIIHVTRENGLPEVRPHSSEQGISRRYVDFELENDGTVDDLYNKVATLVQEGAFNE